MSDLSGQMAAAGWYADPYGRAIQRYFNGTAWTPYVVDAAGNQQIDGPAQAPQQAPSVQAGQGAIVINNVVNSAPQRPMMPVLTGGVMPGAKSPGVAVLLAFLFGGLGVMYVSVGAGLLLFVLMIVSIPTVIGPLLLWGGGMIYAYSAATQHNANLLAAMNSPQPIYGASQPAQQWMAGPTAPNFAPPAMNPPPQLQPPQAPPPNPPTS